MSGVSPSCLQISDWNSAPGTLESSGTKFRSPGNGAAPSQEHFSICVFLMVLSITWLWPSALSLTLSFPPVCTDRSFTSVPSRVSPCSDPELKFSSCFSFTHEYLTAVVYTCWISFAAIYIVQVYCGGRKIKCFVLSDNSLQWFWSHRVPFKLCLHHQGSLGWSLLSAATLPHSPGPLTNLSEHSYPN